MVNNSEITVPVRDGGEYIDTQGEDLTSLRFVVPQDQVYGLIERFVNGDTVLLSDD